MIGFDCKHCLFETCFGSLSGLFLHSFLKGVFKFHQGLLLFVVLQWYFSMPFVFSVTVRHA